MDKQVFKKVSEQIEALKSREPEAVKAYLLTVMATDMTRDILTPEFAHKLPLWKAVLGGYVGKSMQNLMPEQIDEKRQALIEQYGKEAIEKLLNPEKEVVEKVVEKVVYRDRPTSAAPAQDGLSTQGVKGVNFRYRPKVNKVSRMKRTLAPDERRIIIEQFNQLQKMMDPNDEVCKRINAQISTSGPKLSNPQIAGYWSWLCRVVNFATSHQQEWYNGAIKSGSLPQGCPMPTATDEFKREIMSNAKFEAMIKAEREKYKARMATVKTTAASPAHRPSSINFS